MVDTISVLTSSKCNLNCSFCFLHKHEALNKYDQTIIETWKNKKYFQNVSKALIKLEEKPEDITQINFWGGETLYHIDLITENIEEMFKYFPNISIIALSTNWTMNIEKYFNFVKKLNGLTKHKILIRNQCSIDGPPGPISDIGHNGWDKYEKNFELFTNLCNQTKLKNIDLFFFINAVVRKDIYLTEFTKYEGIKNYVCYMMDFLKKLNNMCISESLHVQDNFLFPGYSFPYNSTVEEGLEFAKVIRLWEYVRMNEFPDLAFNPFKDFYEGITDFTHVHQHNYQNEQCCEQCTALTFLPDGTQVECSSSYIENNKEYIKECLEMDDKDRYYSSLLHVANSIDTLNATPEEIQTYNWKVRTGIRNTEIPYQHFIIETCRELALAGQIPKKYYYDTDLLISHLNSILGVLNCTRENINATMNAFLINIGTFRMFLNGAAEYIYENKLTYHKLLGGYYD